MIIRYQPDQVHYTPKKGQHLHIDLSNGIFKNYCRSSSSSSSSYARLWGFVCGCDCGYILCACVCVCRMFAISHQEAKKQQQQQLIELPFSSRQQQQRSISPGSSIKPHVRIDSTWLLVAGRFASKQGEKRSFSVFIFFPFSCLLTGVKSHRSPPCHHEGGLASGLCERRNQ